MSYEQAWNVLFGDRDAAAVVAEFALVSEGLDEWLGTVEAETTLLAWDRERLTAELGEHHQRVLGELQGAIGAGVNKDLIEEKALNLRTLIRDAERELRDLAEQRAPVTATELCDGCNFDDRAVEAQVQRLADRYDAVRIDDLADSEDLESWELIAGGSERYVAKEDESGDWIIRDTEDPEEPYSEGLEEDEATEEAERLNRDETIENLAGFPFAHSWGYELDGKYEIEQFASAGFLVWRYKDDRLIAGIDGGGYSFLGAHWFPLWVQKFSGSVIDTDTGPRRLA